MNSKLWGGRFGKATDPLLERFSRSISYDAILAGADIRAGIAHAEGLERLGHLNAQERDLIVKTLSKIGEDIDSGKLDPGASEHEDIHTLVLNELALRAGEVAKKLHAGRSRNDLVSLDTRLYLREALCGILAELATLQASLVVKAGEYEDVIIPGLTHTQHAQVVLFPHHLLAYVEMLERDRGRVSDALARMDVLPAGSAAMGGSSLRLDQRFLARRLEFREVSRNSMDAVGDRDFVIETLSALAVVGMHLSRLAEELVWWSSSEIGFAELDEAYTTGSSFLPQKRNPDSAELIRGKTGRLYGNLVAVLTMMKGLPLTYNRDMQEDKEPLFDSLFTVADSLSLMAGIVLTLKVDRAAAADALVNDFSSSSDLAEFLVTQKVPFAEAHAAVGRLVRWCLEEEKSFPKLTLEELRQFHPDFEKAALKLLTPAGSLQAKKTLGSSNPRRVRTELERWCRRLSD